MVEERQLVEGHDWTPLRPGLGAVDHVGVSAKTRTTDNGATVSAVTDETTYLESVHFANVGGEVYAWGALFVGQFHDFFAAAEALHGVTQWWKGRAQCQSP